MVDVEGYWESKGFVPFAQGTQVASDDKQPDEAKPKRPDEFRSLMEWCWFWTWKVSALSREAARLLR